MAQQASYITLTDANFQQQVLESEVPVLVDFWAAWCGPCRAIAPAIEQLAAEFEGKVKVGKLNVDEHPLSAQQYSVRSIPTLLFFERGEVVDQHVGVAPKSLLASKMEALLQAV